jgi:KDO2-lipid IV(A) lauroyltransferase
MFLGRLLGKFWFYVIPIRRAVAEGNVRRALGVSPAEGRRIVRRCFEHQTMMAVESMRMPGMTVERAERLMERENWEPFLKAIDEGKGVIVAMAHIGNYEMLACTGGIRGVPFNAVVRDFKSKAVNNFIAEVRRRTNYKTIPPRRSKELIRTAIEDGEPVVLLVDQHMAPHRAVVCEFFGQFASTSPAPARFAFEAGLPIFMCRPRRTERDGYHATRFEPVLELETPYDDHDKNVWHNTERINRVIEKWIREQPEEWLWMHKRWKVHDKPEGWEIRPEVREQVESAQATTTSS